MGGCECVTFWGEWDIAITWHGATLLNKHMVKLLEISMRNFFGKQTQDNNKHAEILYSSLSPPDSGRHRKNSLISLMYTDQCHVGWHPTHIVLHLPELVLSK